MSKNKSFYSIYIVCFVHMYIVELHEVFETSTFIFLVFEICKRGELFDYLTQYVRLSERRTRDFMRQLFDALNYIHERQCVHRDVKPGSISYLSS